MTAWIPDEAWALRTVSLETARNAQEWLEANGPLRRTNQHRSVRAERDRACYRARTAGATLADMAEALGKSEHYAETRFWAGHKLVKGPR